MTKLIPKNGNIILEAIEDKDEEISSGIIIPKTTKGEESLAQGTVIASSGDEYKPGEVVVFNKYQPDDISFKQDGVLKKYWSIHSSNIILTIQND